jgi:poly [ADP-ribose] polymerase
MSGKLLKSRKVSSAQNDGFSETLKHKVAFCGNVIGNNNKFYSIEIQKNPSGQFRIFTHYGRLMKTQVFEVRDEFEDRPITDQSIVEQEFDVILNSKLKGKKIKDEDTGEVRVENYELVDVFAPTVGSDNVRGKAVKTIEVKLDKKTVVSSFSHPEVSRIIKQVIEENVHTISSLTSLKLTSNGFETPLGPVTKEHVQKAREPLNILKSLLVNEELDPELKSVQENNNKYFSLIPHPFGHKIVRDDWILSENKLFEEFEMLDNLESAVKMGAALNDTSKQKSALGSDVDVVEDNNEIERIRKYIETSKAPNHRGMDVWRYRVKNVFKIRIPEERKRYESKLKTLSNQKELFHGSKNCNVLSILKSGLIIPPVNSGQVTGRLFGNGIYFANNSTKSLNYSGNFWNRSYISKNNNLFLFLANVLMGKEYKVSNYYSGNPPKGFDSLYAQRGTQLHNDEFIVYNLSQATLSYLVEMI